MREIQHHYYHQRTRHIHHQPKPSLSEEDKRDLARLAGRAIAVGIMGALFLAYVAATSEGE